MSLSAWRMVTDRSGGVFLVQRVAAGIVLAERRIEIDRVRGIELKRAILIKGSPGTGDMPQRLFQRRIRQREVVTLSLLTDEESVVLDSATDAAALRDIGNRIADHAGITFGEVSA